MLSDQRWHEVRGEVQPSSDAPAELLVNCVSAIETKVDDVPFIAIAPPEMSAMFPEKLPVAIVCEKPLLAGFNYNSSVQAPTWTP